MCANGGDRGERDKSARATISLSKPALGKGLEPLRRQVACPIISRAQPSTLPTHLSGEAPSSHGANPKLEYASVLWDPCLEYFEWIERNPLLESKVVTAG